MAPTLDDGDWILVEDDYYQYSEPIIGEVVLVEHPEKIGFIMVKRIAAQQGEGFVVLGDNPTQSTDSRQFGLLNRSQLKARVCSRL